MTHPCDTRRGVVDGAQPACRRGTTRVGSPGASVRLTAPHSMGLRAQYGISSTKRHAITRTDSSKTTACCACGGYDTAPRTAGDGETGRRGDMVEVNQSSPVNTTFCLSSPALCRAAEAPGRGRPPRRPEDVDNARAKRREPSPSQERDESVITSDRKHRSVSTMYGHYVEDVDMLLGTCGTGTGG